MRDIDAADRVVSPAGEHGIPHQRQAHEPVDGPEPPGPRELDRDDATATVVLDGPYTLTNSGRILERVSEALRHYGITQIVLDMSRVTVLDFAAVLTLQDAYLACHAKGTKLSIREASIPALDALRASFLDSSLS